MKSVTTSLVTCFNIHLILPLAEKRIQPPCTLNSLASLEKNPSNWTVS